MTHILKPYYTPVTPIIEAFDFSLHSVFFEQFSIKTKQEYVFHNFVIRFSLTFLTGILL